MFLLRNHSLLHESQQCLSEMCKIMQSRMSSGKYVSVRVLPPLSKQMISLNLKSKDIQQLEFKKKGAYGIMDLAKRGHIDQAEQLFKRLQSVPKLKLGVGVCMSLFDMHVKAGNVQEAVDALQRMHLLHPHVILQPYKVLTFATLLLKRGQTERCLQLLREEAPDETCHSAEQIQQQWNPGTRHNIMTRLGQRLMQVAADEGDVALTQQLLDELLHLGYCTPSRLLLAPLVRVHFVRSDHEAALSAMEWMAEKHRCLPCKAELLQVLIYHQETKSLTRLMELSCAVIGRPQAVFDLAVALLEASQLDRAARIIKQEQVRLDTERLQYLCKLYVTRRQPQHLLSLLQLSHACGTASKDSVMIRAHLHACHELAGNTKAANDLLTKLEREGVTKDDLLSHVPAREAGFGRDESLDEAPRERRAAIPAGNTRSRQRSGSLPRQSHQRDTSPRSSSVSMDVALYSDATHSSARPGADRGEQRKKKSRKLEACMENMW